MRAIDRYLDKVYKHNYDDTALELREEMKQHLLDLVEELQEQGYNEKEACKLAIKQFGDERVIGCDIEKMFKAKHPLLAQVKHFLPFIIGACMMIMGVLTYQSLGCQLYDLLKNAKARVFTEEQVLPLDQSEVDDLNAMVSAVHNVGLRYFKVYKIEDNDDDEYVRNDDTLFNTNSNKHLAGKKLVEAYEYGEPYNPRYQSFAYNSKYMNWYAEYEVDSWKGMIIDYYALSNSILFLSFISGICIYINMVLNKTRLRYRSKVIFNSK